MIEIDELLHLIDMRVRQLEEMVFRIEQKLNTLTPITGYSYFD